MLQNISKNKHEKEGDEFAPQSTKYGGSLKRFIDGGEEDCREGYMKNENGHCVPSVAPEQVDADEWYRNWYANRVIQDEEGQKLLNEARPKILKRAEKFPEVQYFEESGPEAGYYSPKTGNIKLNSTLVGNNPFLKNEVLFHEKGHYLTYPSLKDPEMDTYKKMLQHPIHKMKEYETDVIKNALVRKKNVPKKDRKYFKYISGDYGEEISKRIMEMRRLAGFKPDQVITDKDVEDFYKKAAEKGWTNPESDKFVEPLHDLKIYTKSPEEIKNLLNKLAKNEPEQVDEFQPQLAKYGGSKNKYIEVDIPEEEIQWYIDNGYRVEPVSKLKKFIG
jgi:predicted SprT family Zn-dependent metalloprotease